MVSPGPYEQNIQNCLEKKKRINRILKFIYKKLYAKSTSNIHLGVTMLNEEEKL